MYNKEKIIISDWGGVVESHYEGEYNINKAVTNIIKKLNSDVTEENLVSRYELCNYDEFGRNISTYCDIEHQKKWIDRIRTEFNLNCTFEEFCNVYKEEYNKVHYYKEVVKLIHSMKKYCNIGILSNLGSLDKERIDKQFNLEKFDYIWLSFELGYIKPDEKIYEYVENDCSIKPNNIIFIDDNEDNIEAARQRKWNVCLANGHQINKIKDSISTFLGTNII